ncbi:MAG TPA: PAS domain S-box protein [Anaerolineaceae bacterium]
MSSRRFSQQIEAAQARMAALVDQAAVDASLSDPIVETLFHGLTRHLGELTAIDDELREQSQLLLEARATMDLERQRYRDLFEFAPSAYIVTDQAGIIREANHAATELFLAPLNALLGKPLRLYIAAPDRKRFLNHLKLLRSSQNPGKWELAIQPGGKPTWIDTAVCAAPFLDRDGRLTMLCWMIRDITSDKAMEAALREANQELENRVHSATDGMQMALTALRENQERLLLAKQAGEIGIWDWKPQEGNLTMDEQCSCLFELPGPVTITRTELLNRVYPDDRELVATVLEENRLGMAPRELEYRIICPEAGIRWVYSKGITIQNHSGYLERVTGIVLDITRQKKAAEEERRSTIQDELQHLLIDQREKERLQIARDLHDGPLQELIGAVFLLQGVIQDAGDLPLAESLRYVKNSLQNQVEDLRTFAGQLRSATLFKFGLEKAIRDHLEGFQQKYPGVAVQIEAEPESPPLIQTVRLALYRICQEALNNAVRHGDATHITIRMCFSETSAQLAIQDNGSGFNVPTEWIELARQGHLGLVGIRERGEAAGGQVEIRSHPGDGTTIHVAVPTSPPMRTTT